METLPVAEKKAPEKGRSRPSRFWMAPAFGVALAAAAAALVVVPMAGKLAPADLARDEARRELGPAAAPAVPPPSAIAELDG